MKRLAAAFDRYWYAPLPAARLATLRMLIGGFALVYLVVRLPNLATVAAFDRAAFMPVGPVSILSEPLPAWLVAALPALAIVFGVPVVLGLHYRVVAPIFALLFLWVTSYRNSWGMIFHTENLLALHVLVLGFAPASDALGLDAKRSGRAAEPAGAYGWPIRSMTFITVVVYVLAGVAKLELGGPAWLEGELLRAQIAYDNLRKIELGSFHSPLGVALVRHSWPFGPLAFLTLLVELGAPMALFGTRLALVWSACAWSFHVGVVVLMAIFFPYQLYVVAYAPFFEVERLLETRLGRFVAARFAPAVH